MKLKLLPTFIALSASSLAFADDKQSHQLPDLIINADFRPSLASETPISLTEIDEETIESRGAQHIEEILNLAPNVNVASGASRGQYYQIRGIGERSQFNAPLNPSVGLVIDGVDFSRTGGAATLFDIESVDILRGPQGTKFGTNALAGTILMRSKEPTNDFDLHAEAGVAEYDTYNTGVAVGGTLIENSLLGRASVYSHRSDGYMENDALNRNDTMQQDELTLRGKLKWLATDDLTVDFSYLHLDIDNGYDAFTLDNTRTSQSDDPGVDQQNTNAFAVKADWQASDAVIIQSEVTYLNSDIVYSYDADWGYVGQFDDDLWPYVGFERYDRERDNYSFELRALSDEAGRIFNGTTDWTIGIYHISQDEDFKQDADWGIYGGVQSEGEYDTKNTALYGQLDTHLTEKLTLVTGARVEYFEADYSDTANLEIDPDEMLYGGKIGLNYQATEQHFLYTSLARGYKSGGVNNNATLSPDQREFDSEYNYSFEAGVKSNWLAGRLLTDINVFYTDRRDAQVKNSTAVGVSFVDYIDNAASATHQGIEASADWLVTDKVRLFGSLGLLDAEFDDYEDESKNLEGREVAYAPDYTFSIGTELYLTNALTVRANVEGKDEFYFSDSHDAKSDSYSVVNASADYRIKQWTVRVWARNLFDEDYYTRGFYFANNPGNGWVDEKYVQYAEPRVAGVTLTYDY